MSRSVPPQVEAGTDLTLKVKVACPAGCDLRGRLVKVMAPAGIVVQRELIGFENLTNETDEFVVTAPPQVGEYAWNVVFPRHELKGVVHEESALTITSRTMPHPTSIAVWDVPSPVIVNSSFEVKAGLKCLVSCQLPGQLIAVRDEEGLQVGEGKLGDTPWPGTSALYGTKVNRLRLAGESVEITILYLYFWRESAINLAWPMNARIPSTTRGPNGSATTTKRSRGCRRSRRARPGNGIRCSVSMISCEVSTISCEVSMIGCNVRTIG